jgi:hypothetical protein
MSVRSVDEVTAAPQVERLALATGKHPATTAAPVMLLQSFK